MITIGPAHAPEDLAARAGPPVRLFYWEGKKNFGDLIGPWLVGMMTHRPTVNVRGRLQGPALAAVGSIIGMFDRPGLEVWGSGLMAVPDAETLTRLRKNPPGRIHAVRGWQTYKELTTKLGWGVPKIYGDPALLLPRFYRPRPVGDPGGVVLCPHFGHKDIFAGLEGDEIRRIDVQDDPDAVVDIIANAGACISTSLHGLIVAQAYGVPWVWLEVEGRKLGGTNFKFEDFFTVLDRSAVRSERLPAADCTHATLLALARTASLPASKFDFSDLLDAFPM